jgi:hypothetical protein
LWVVEPRAKLRRSIKVDVGGAQLIRAPPRPPGCSHPGGGQLEAVNLEAGLMPGAALENDHLSHLLVTESTSGHKFFAAFHTHNMWSPKIYIDTR